MVRILRGWEHRCHRWCHRWWQYWGHRWPVAKFLREYSAVRPANLVAALAFRGVLSLFPLAVLILAIYDYVGQPYLSRGSVLTTIAVLFPYVPNGEVERVLQGIGLNFGWWGLASALGLAWSSSFFFGSLEAAFNRIYNARNRAFLAGRLMFTLMALAFSVLLLMMAAASVLLPTIKNVLTFFLGWWPLGGAAFWAGLVAATLRLAARGRAEPSEIARTVSGLVER